ncbi:MAG: radical SAM protein [Bradymonadaceae bacterium]|nr:radical SAM protein [Lujinxingiaceae bacterium]
MTDASTRARAILPADLEKPHPLYCVWEITLQCDLGCKHCGSRAGKARPDELSTAECFEVVEQLAALGLREVTLIGGEAYLRDDWHLIAAEITRQGMVCGMTTGARNLDQRRIDQAVEAGMKIISISIDGLEHTHDALRGLKGSWKAATDAARRVAASPIRLATNTQINRLSMPELPAMAELLAEIGSKAWQLQLTVPMGRAADRPELVLQPYDLLELFPLLVWIKQTKLEPAGIGMYPSNNIGYYGPYEQLLRFGGERGAHWKGCSAGKWTLGLEADGKIKGCPSLPSDSYTGGNIRTMGIAEAVESTPELRYFRERTTEDLWGYCKTCYYADECKAGCSWTSHCMFGKPGNNVYCIHRATQHERQGLRERLVKRAPAPGKPFDHGLFDVIVEPMPDAGDTPNLLDLVEQAGLAFDSGGAWQRDVLKDHLRKA